MQTLKMSITIAACLLAIKDGVAQEVAYVDAVNDSPRLQLRYPPPPPSKCTPDGRCFGGGVSSGGVADCGTAVDNPHAVRGSLTWLDRGRYTEGDSIVFEAKLENVGSVPWEIPVWPHLADLQPKDPRESFSSNVLGIGIDLPLPRGGDVSLGGIRLYGSSDSPGTVMTLQPHQWVRLRAKITTSLTDSQREFLPADGLSEGASVGLYEQKTTYKFHVGGVSSMARGMCPRVIEGEHMQMDFIAKKNVQP